MRELLAEEMGLVAGGQKPQAPINLRGFTVRPPRPAMETLPYHPPTRGSGGHHGGGGRAVHMGQAGGGLSPQATAGIARIKDQLGVDLTAYAQMSPSLAQAISNATATFDFQFEWRAGPSTTVWTDGSHGRITIDSAYTNNTGAFLQQMAHELGHAGWHVQNNTGAGAEHFIKAHLEGEGYATLMGERVNHEVRAASNVEISVASSNVAANRPMYDAEYARWSSGQEGMQQAANNIGDYFSQHETTRGMTYHDYYLSEYHRLGGR